MKPRLTANSLLPSATQNAAAHKDAMREEMDLLRDAIQDVASTRSWHEGSSDSWELEVAVAGLLRPAEQQLDDAATTVSWALTEPLQSLVLGEDSMLLALLQ